MKICILASSFPKWDGDFSSFFVYELGQSLLTHGYDLHILTPHAPGSKVVEQVNGLKIHRFPYFYPTIYQKLSQGGMFPNIKRSFVAKIQLPFLFFAEIYHTLKIIKKENIDVLNSHWILPQGLVGAIIKKFTGKKHLLTIHAGGLFALETLPFKHKVTNFIVVNCDHVTVVSSYNREKLLNLVTTNLRPEIEKKIKIIPMGVNIEKFIQKDKTMLRAKYGTPIDTSMLLFVGRLSEKKGIEYIIKAMAIIIKNDKNIKLWIIGSGELEGDLKSLVNKLQLNDHIEFRGKVGEEELIESYILADIMIVPSIVTSYGDTEGMPVVIMEALASGKPIITTDVGGITDAIMDGDTGILVQQKSSEELAKKIYELINDEELREHLSKNAVKCAREKFSWDVIANKYDQLIQDQ